MKYLLFLALLFLPFRTEAQTATINCTIPISTSGTFQCPVTVTVPPVTPPVVTPPIVIPPPTTGTCPMGNAFPDGCATAPLNAVTPRHAVILAKYGSKRPPWNVAGVDYEVGLDKTLALTDWRSLPNAVVGSSGTHYLRCPGGGTFSADKIDFTKGGGAFSYTGAGDACTVVNITRSKMGCDVLNATGPGNVALVQIQKVITGTISDSDVSLANCGGIGGGQITNSFGGVTMLRVHYDNSGVPPANVGGGQFAYGGTLGAPNTTVMVTNSFIGNMNNVKPNAACTGPAADAAHNNGAQWNQIGPNDSFIWRFNTYYQSINDSCIDQGGEMVQTYPNDRSLAPGKLASGDISFNTIIALRGSTGHTTLSNAFNSGGAGCGGTCIFDANWMDASGAFSYSYPGGSAGWSARSGSSPFFALGTGAAVGFTP